MSKGTSRSAVWRSKNRKKARSWSRAWSKKHSNKRVAYNKEYRRLHRSTVLRWRKTQHLKALGWTQALYEEALRMQDGKCSICKCSEEKNKPLHADHDHSSGKRRELLCFKCNAALGLLKDDPELLEIAAEYLRRHGK